MTSSMSLAWCKKNLSLFSQDVFDLLQEEYPEIQMEVKECVDVCGLCTDIPFALRNNSIISARDPRGLYAKLKKGMGFLELPALPGTYAGMQANACILQPETSNANHEVERMSKE